MAINYHLLFPENTLYLISPWRPPCSNLRASIRRSRNIASRRLHHGSIRQPLRRMSERRPQQRPLATKDAARKGRSDCKQHVEGGVESHSRGVEAGRRLQSAGRRSRQDHSSTDTCPADTTLGMLGIGQPRNSPCATIRCQML